MCNKSIKVDIMAILHEDKFHSVLLPSIYTLKRFICFKCNTVIVNTDFFNEHSIDK